MTGTPTPKKPKQPQDHLPKKNKPAKPTSPLLGDVDDSPVVVEYLGATFSIRREALDDYELIELIGDPDLNVPALVAAFRRLLGVEQHDKLKELIRDEGTNRVSAIEMVEHLQQLLSELMAALSSRAEETEGNL